MAKQIIRLTESDLHRIVEESVNNVIAERGMSDIDILKTAYQEIQPCIRDFGSKWAMTENQAIKEAYQYFVQGVRVLGNAIRQINS